MRFCTSVVTSSTLIVLVLSPSSDNTLCGVEFAVARTLVPACVRIWARVRFAVSAAKSASRMLLSLAVTFSSATCSEFTFVSSVFFSNAPSRPRRIATWLMARSMILLALADCRRRASRCRR